MKKIKSSICIVLWGGVLILLNCGVSLGGELRIRETASSKFTNINEFHVMPFSNKNTYIDFEYIIKRQNKEDRIPGAVLVKQIRVHDHRWKLRSNLWNKTILYRNAFPEQNRLWSDLIVRRTMYRNYHLGRVTDLDIEYKFHGRYLDSQKTFLPETRRDNFLFSDFSQKKCVQRASLFYYNGVKEEGTHVPFKIGISNAFNHIIISIVDLNPPKGAGYAQQNWQIIKKE